MTAAHDPGPTAQHRAAAVLRAAILDGELRPGQRVNQEDWAARAGVSLIPLREALNGLAGEGLVTHRPRRGYVVTELALDDLEEVYALRRLLESEALRRGVPHATDDDVALLAAAARACRAAARGGDLAARLETNRVFHEHLHALAGSRPLSRLIDLLWDSTEAYRALYYALRRLLETEALRRGVPRATDDDVALLAAAARTCRAAARGGDLAARLKTNRVFHERLHALAGSRPLSRLIDLLWDSTEAYRALYYALPGEATRADRAHDEIVAAVTARDTEAAVRLQDAHRDRALARLRVALAA